MKLRGGYFLCGGPGGEKERALVLSAVGARPCLRSVLPFLLFFSHLPHSFVTFFGGGGSTRAVVLLLPFPSKLLLWPPNCDGCKSLVKPCAPCFLSMLGKGTLPSSGGCFQSSLASSCVGVVALLHHAFDPRQPFHEKRPICSSFAHLWGIPHSLCIPGGL